MTEKADTIAETLDPESRDMLLSDFTEVEYSLVFALAFNSNLTFAIATKNHHNFSASDGLLM